VVAHHATDPDVSPHERSLRAEFETAIPERLTAIKGRWRVLTLHRHGYLAHRDLTKLEMLPPITYQDIRDAIEWAQAVCAAYVGAYGANELPVWRMPAMETEPERFLRWCRLDDYEKHLDEQQSTRTPDDMEPSPGKASAT
jgi:hypothetical protein